MSEEEIDFNYPSVGSPNKEPVSNPNEAIREFNPEGEISPIKPEHDVGNKISQADKKFSDVKQEMTFMKNIDPSGINFLSP